ncbi:MAG: alpha/beta hydrolase [Phenylobacterium sp.]|nr:alpha/beta hydrolase [Phenylobacterium sp.]
MLGWRSKRFGLALVMAASLAGAGLTGCATSNPLSIDLMPAPEAFDDGAMNPLPQHNPIADLPYGGMLYATDRAPVAAGEDGHYSSLRGQVLRLGAAKVAVGETNITWEEARRISLLKNRPGSYPLKVTGVVEFGPLDTTLTPLVDPGPAPADPKAAGRTFAGAIDAKLSGAAEKDVYIYVHGYKVGFENPILVGSELWHFLGYKGVFIAYSWPATPKASAYIGDSDTAAGMARNLRELVAFIEANTQAERIHIIGYSAGTRLVARAVEQMAMFNQGAGERRLGAKLENVILVGSDIDRAVFGAYLADGVADVPRRWTIYVSGTDSALRFSSLLAGHARLGRMWRNQELTPQIASYLKSHEGRVDMVNVTGVAGAETANGHGYFRSSPWVSSDVLMTLAYNLSPEERGLVRDPATGLAQFPTDYVERMRSVLAVKYAPKPGGP